MEHDLSVIVPCFNEAKNLRELVARITNVFRKKNIAGEIILVNDGSSDNTGVVITELAEEFGHLVGIHHKVNRGIAAAWRSGLALARGRYVCFIDADLQNLPEDIWRLYREYTTSTVDLVQGYRSSVGRLKDSRYLLSKGLTFLLNLLFRMRLRDTKSGFVMGRREILEDVLRHRFRYSYFQTFIAVSAAAKGYSIREIETLFESRLLGTSFMSRFPISVVLWSLVDITKALFEFRLLHKRENIVAEFLSENQPSRRDPPLPAFRRFWLAVFFATMPLHKWMITSRARLYYRELKRSQWLSPEKIIELQEKKLRRLIHHAYHHVGFWRQTFRELGLTPDDIKTVADLRKLPLLSKQRVRENLYFDMLSDNHDKRRILKVVTSGSTGEPFVCYADQHQLEIRWAATQRSLEWTGYRFGDRSARLWHQTLGMTLLQVVRERIDAWFNRRLFVPAFEMSDENIARLVRKLKTHRPVLIDGYAESFNFLADYIKNHGLDGLNAKAVVSSAQALPERSRKLIEETFQCRVFDKYGSREFSGIAYECEAHDGHHVVAESYIVEVLKDGVPASPGELGEVVITDLNNFCMPLIRYRVGDLAVAMDATPPCPCGRGLPRIGRIEGRIQAIVFGTNGTYMPGTFFSHLFKDYDHIIRQYQVVQDTPGEIHLRVVKARRFDEEVFEEILDLLRKYLGPDMKISVEFVTHVPLIRTGKHQGSISLLDVDFQRIEARPQARDADAP